MNVFNIKNRVVLSAIIIAFVASPLAPFALKPAQAQADPASVQTSCGFSFMCILKHWKDFVGDKLAVMIANQLIQKMTASTVTWINTGFQGSPAFLQNPEGFFTDVGDQITGEFLDATKDITIGTGASKRSVSGILCSPFSYSLRLNLALNRAQGDSFNKRYTCTLGSIIQNNKNSLNRSIQNAGITITDDPNGVTLGNFVDGDFSQGGWPGFIAYTTQPQNNPIGAWIMADSDIQSKIDQKKVAVNNDLNRGQGFMSWQSCTDVTNQFTIDPSAGGSDVPADGRSPLDIAASKYGLNSFDLNNLEKNGYGSTGYNELGKSTGIKKVKNSNGSTSYQNCSVQTPGSALASTLFNTADTPREKLVLVKTISDSIDAITGALINQMLTKGLAALSGNGSGVGGNSKAYLTQLNEESYKSTSYDAQSARNRSTGQTNTIVGLARDGIAAYDKALVSLSDTRSKYIAARSCFSTKLTQLTQESRDNQQTFGERMIWGIDMVLSRSVDPLIASTTEKRTAAQNALTGYQNQTSTSITGNTINNDISNAFSRIDASVDSATQATISGIDGATVVQQQSQTLDKTTAMLNKDANTFQGICNQFPGGSSQYQRWNFENPLLAAFP